MTMSNSTNIKTGFDKEVVNGGMHKETNSFIWEIANFDAVRKSTDMIKRQSFSFTAGASLNLESEWKFKLHLSENTGLEKEPKWAGCFLYLVKAPVSSNKMFASWKLTISDNCQYTNFCDHEIEAYEYKVQEGGCGYFNVLNLSTELKDLPLTDGSLVIELKFHVYAPKQTSKPMEIVEDATAIEERYKLKFVNKLQQDFAKLLTCTIEGSNVTKIVAMDEVEFTVSPNVLSVRSPVFKTMFEAEMKEATTGIVRITDISSKTMSVLLSFLHTGKLQPDWSHPDVITELVYAVAKYQISDLLEYLDEMVGNVCTKENAGKLMNLARKLSLKTAENNLWEFVKKNATNLEEMFAFIKDVNGSSGS